MTAPGSGSGTSPGSASGPAFAGVLPIDKPEGPTSHDVVAIARRALGERRIGHTGTLDPFATGLLLLCIGNATRIAEYLTALPKTYEATLRLGQTTDTDDLTGEVIASNDALGDVDEDAVRAAFAAQMGTIRQIPPRYSAKKVAGRRMYESARAGDEVERTPVEVTISGIDVTRIAPPEVDFTVDCSSGTYIRAIARDVGETLGIGAHLTALRRTRIGVFDVRAAIGLDDLADRAAVQRILLAPAAALAHLPAVVLGDDAVAAIGNGRAVDAPTDLAAAGPIRLMSEGGALLAIAERRADTLQPRKVFL
jgi:tRNA pseudouridine55 synthase